MANQEHIKLLKRGVDAWNAWRRELPEMWPDLTGTNLSRADLSHADLSRTNLLGANLTDANLRNASLLMANLSTAHLCNAKLTSAMISHADLTYADLTNADLSYANLIEANLVGANLNLANLSHSDLTHAHLTGVHFTSAILTGADLTKSRIGTMMVVDANSPTIARLATTTFANVDLRNTKGLVEIEHTGSSNVQLHTVQLPQDGSALHFLRGTGVPDEWIDDCRTHMMNPIQYHSCFISYSNQDETLARRLYADLQDHGVRCWFAPEDMKIGDNIHTRINESIHLYDKLLLVLSQHSLTSAWVEREVAAALEKEQQQGRRVLFPIRLDESVMQTSHAWAADIQRRKHIGDFTRWKQHDDYQQALERLLRDLKTEEEK